MNGRVYDPLIGRMTSADPTVPDAMNPQAWNRYSYVGNDPLAFTDPSGYSWLSEFFHGIANLFNSVPILRSIVQIVITAVLSPFVGPVAAAAAGAAIINGLSGGNLGSMLKSAAIAGATAFAFDVVGTVTLGPAHASPTIGSNAYFANVAGHAGVGCLSSVASGGSCQSGAMSGAVGAAASPLVRDVFPNPKGNTGDLIGGTAASGVVGGFASLAGGGKFENGAVTAAFGYMYNAAGMALCLAGPAGCAVGATITAGQLLGGAAVAGALISAGKWLSDTVYSKRLTPDQDALKDLVDGATNGGRKPLSAGDAETVLDWGKETGYPGVRASPGDVSRPSNWSGSGGQPHIHVPGIGSGHIPVEDGVKPR